MSLHSLIFVSLLWAANGAKVRGTANVRGLLWCIDICRAQSVLLICKWLGDRERWSFLPGKVLLSGYPIPQFYCHKGPGSRDRYDILICASVHANRQHVLSVHCSVDVELTNTQSTGSLYHLVMYDDQDVRIMFLWFAPLICCILHFQSVFQNSC